MTDTRVGFTIGLAAAILPWLTWLPTHAVVGDATPDVIQAPARLLALLPMLLIAARIFLEDMWLGAFVLYAAAWQWAQPGRFWGAIEATAIAFGALAVLLVRGLSPESVTRRAESQCPHSRREFFAGIVGVGHGRRSARERQARDAGPEGKRAPRGARFREEFLFA